MSDRDTDVGIMLGAIYFFLVACVANQTSR